MPIYSDSTLCEALAGGLVTGTTSRVRCGPKGAAPAAPPPNAPNPPDLRGPLPGCKTASGRPKREVATCEGSVLGRLDETIPRNRERRSQLDGIYLFVHLGHSPRDSGPKTSARKTTNKNNATILFTFWL